MRAVLYREFKQRPELVEVAKPAPPAHGVVVRVTATGLCRSDWHGWQGHDSDIRVPHVPGHEFAGVVEQVGEQVRRWRPGTKVTAPFVHACGRCQVCQAGDGQVCPKQTQPGFTNWGSFAEYVVVDHADVNLIGLPGGISDTAASILGCRFATAFRAVVHQGRVAAGEWVAIHGAGGVGLSAVMIAIAAGARVVAVDISDAALQLAHDLGAAATLNTSELAGPGEVASAVAELTGGGAQLSLDALGNPDTCAGSILSLSRRGRHVQVGLLPQAPRLPMDRVIAYELELRGSHGMPAHAYSQLLELISAGVLQPERLITRFIGLDEAPRALAELESTSGGTTVIELDR